MLQFHKQFMRHQNNALTTFYGKDPTQLFFAKSLGFMLISCSAVMLVVTLFFTFSGSNYFSETTRLIFFPVNFIPVFAFLYAYKLLILGKYLVARNIFTIITICAIVISIVFTGGFFKSTAAPFLVVVPVMVYLFYGLRAGTRIAILVPVIIAAQQAAFVFGDFALPDYSSTANINTNILMSNSALYILIIAMVATYEYQRDKLRKELQAEQSKLARLANKDPLTGLSNTRHFYALLEKYFQESKKNKSPLTILFLDLDRFKQINDNFGHHVGDVVLLEVSERLRNFFSGKAILARLGGDEFAALCTTHLCEIEIESLRETLTALISQPIYSSDFSCNIGVSIGFSLNDENMKTKEQFLKQADTSMYQHKAGKFKRAIRDELQPFLNNRNHQSPEKIQA